jgi:hypothetical protein
MNPVEQVYLSRQGDVSLVPQAENNQHINILSAGDKSIALGQA